MNVIAVDMYDGKVAATPDSAMKLMRGADMGRMAAIIQGAIKKAGADASIYSVGWCFGGMWSLQTAILAGPQAKGTVSHGRSCQRGTNCEGFWQKKCLKGIEAI